MSKDLLWHDVTRLPTPGIEIVVELDTGLHISAIRPNYIDSYNSQFKGYHDLMGNKLHNVKLWRHK